MRPQRPTRSSVNAALALALAGAILAVPTLARAGDDQNVPIDTKIVRSVLHALGLRSSRDKTIVYQERAPLVIPPNDNLPPPQKPGAAIADNSAWPKDPDVARAKIQAAQNAKPRNIVEEDLREMDPLPPDQLAPGAKTYKGHKVARRTEPPDPGSTGDGGDPLTPSQLGYHNGMLSWKRIFGGGQEDTATAAFTGEPLRTSLTEPPPGYQTPSPDQPYGLGHTAQAPKATNSYTTRGEVTGDNN